MIKIRDFIFSWTQLRLCICMHMSSCLICIICIRDRKEGYNSFQFWGLYIWEELDSWSNSVWMKVCCVWVRERGGGVEELLLLLAFLAKSQLWLWQCILQCELSERWGVSNPGCTTCWILAENSGISQLMHSGCFIRLLFSKLASVFLHKNWIVSPAVSVTIGLYKCESNVNSFLYTVQMIKRKLFNTLDSGLQ